MKNHRYTLLALSAFLLAAVSAGCSDDIEADTLTGPAADCFNLAVSVPLSAPSRADSDPLNEYKVNSLHLFFYSATDHDDNSSEYLFHYVTDQSFEYSKTLRFNLPDDALLPGGLFGESGSECLVYAVANVDESLLTEHTVSALKATVVSSDFDRTEVQPAFAMDAMAKLALDRTNRSVSGDINLQRAAAKLTLAINLPESIDVTETEINPQDGASRQVVRTYFPRPEQMHVWMGNGVKMSALNTAPTPAAAGCLFSNEISTAEGVGSSFSHSEELLEYPYMQHVPFYSYPNEWVPSNPAGNSHLTLVVPWQYEDENNVTQSVATYYRLAVQPTANRISRNTHYDMRVAISRLGSITPQAPLEITSEWDYALPWNAQSFTTDIKNIRYLVLNNNYMDKNGVYVFTMNNETEISIPYSTSHQAQIIKVDLIWRDYLNNANREIPLTLKGESSNGESLEEEYYYSDIAGYDPETIFAGIELDHANSTLRLKRNMLHLSWTGKQTVNMITKEPAFNAYTFDITLIHQDQAGLSDNDPAKQIAKVRITQYPDIYITSQLTVDESHRIINANNTDKNIDKGFLSNNDNTETSDFYLGPLDRDDNHHTYIINITRFEKTDNTENYMIGDPRSLTANNYGPSWTMMSPALSDYSPGNVPRMLTNYYPADPTNATKKNYIAPRLRIASQFGVSSRLKKDNARRRCASYQENGRPAGRWRLPTVNEIKFIADLSSKQYIPYLFGNKTSENEITYWCGTGAVTVMNNANQVVEVSTTTDSKHYVRCVYDEWYWGTDTLAEAHKATFVWGDKPRSFSGNR